MMQGKNKSNIHVSFITISFMSALVLTVISWIFIMYESSHNIHRLFDSKTLIQANSLLTQLIGFNQNLTLSSQLNAWFDLRFLAYETLLMSLCAIGISGIIALASCIFATRTFHDGSSYGYPSIPFKVLYFGVRTLYSFTRAMPELILAIILMLFFTPGIWVATLALAIHNIGVLGKLYSESIEDMNTASIKSLQTSGAKGGQLLFYTILPQLLPQFLTYLLYRWEVIIRTTVVVGLVSASGLGREFRLSFSYFHYSDLGLLLIWYILLVVGVDLVCAGLRNLIKDRS